MRQYLDLLRRNRDIRLIWFAEVTSLMGDWFSQVVLLPLVVAASPPDRAGLSISALILARFVPPLLLSPYAGVLLDRFNRQRLLVWSNYLRALIGLSYLLAIADPSLLWTVFAGVIVQSILGTVYPPGQSALVASVVVADDLVTANTLSNATWSAALAAGGALGGLVAAAFGPTVALLIDAATFVVAGVLVGRVRGYMPRPLPLQTDAPAQADEIAEALAERQANLADGLRYVRAHRPTLYTLFVKFGGSLSNVDSIMTIIATKIFVMGVQGQLSMGIVYSAFGIGAILGPFIANMLNDGSGRSLRRWILAGFVMQALGWLALGWAGMLIVVCIGLVMRAMGGSLNWTYSSVLLQRTTPDEYRGRVFALDMTLFNLATVFATLVHGFLIDALGAEHFAWIAFGTAAISAIPLAGWLYAMRVWDRPTAEREDAASTPPQSTTAP